MGEAVYFIFSTVAATVVCVALPLNISVVAIYRLLSKPKRKLISNFVFLCQALNDMYIGLYLTVFAIDWSYWSEGEDYAEKHIGLLFHLSKLSYFLYHQTFHLNISVLFVASLERFVATTFPHIRQAYITRRTVGIAMLVGYLLSFVTPVVYITHVYNLSNKVEDFSDPRVKRSFYIAVHKSSHL